MSDDLNIKTPEDEELSERVQDFLRRKEEFLRKKGYFSSKKGLSNSAAFKLFSGLIGFAIGDALGVPVEFLSRDELTHIPVKEMVGYGSHYVPEGTWSDDTSMVLATMDSIVEKKQLDYEDIMTKFCNWYYSASYTATGNVFDIGKTVNEALTMHSYGVPALQCGGSDIMDNGNGSLMRILPIAYYLASKNLREEEEVTIINDASSLTHSHEISRLGCKIYSDYIKELIQGKDKKDALEMVKQYDYSKYYSEDSIKQYKRILNDDISLLSQDEILSTSYVVSTLEASLWATLTSDSYEEAVCKAVNLGKDTDTIGALTGALNGIIYGKSQIPSHWIRDLKNKEYLYSLGDKFIETLKSISLGDKNEEKSEVQDMFQEPISTSETSDYNNQHK